MHVRIVGREQACGWVGAIVSLLDGVVVGMLLFEKTETDA